MTETTRMPTCPMAETCKGMMGDGRPGLMMTIPGLVFIALGVAIMLYPRILPWLVSIALISIGVAILMMANFIRGIGRRLHG